MNSRHSSPSQSLCLVDIIIIVSEPLNMKLCNIIDAHYLFMM